MRERLGLHTIVIVGLISAILLIVAPVSAAALTATNSTYGEVDNGLISRVVTITQSEPVTDVYVSIEYVKMDDPCPPDGGSNSPHFDEIAFFLTSPAGTTIHLINVDIYPNGDFSEVGRVVVTFDDTAAGLIGGSSPVTGTFRPAEPLSTFYGQNTQGDWTLIALDSTLSDPLCFYSFTLYLNYPDASHDASPAASSPFSPVDGRINHHEIDRAAPVAIYCKAYGIEVYGVDPATGNGSTLPIISMTNEAVAAMGVPTGAPLLLGQYADVTLWRLTTGELQVNTHYAADGKPWVFVWDACPMTSSSHLSS